MYLDMRERTGSTYYGFAGHTTGNIIQFLINHECAGTLTRLMVAEQVIKATEEVSGLIPNAWEIVLLTSDLTGWIGGIACRVTVTCVATETNNHRQIPTHQSYECICTEDREGGGI